MRWRGNGLGAAGQVSDPSPHLPTPWTNLPLAHCPHVLRPQVPSKWCILGSHGAAGAMHLPGREAWVPACLPRDAFHSGHLGEIETTHGSICLQMSIKCWLWPELCGLGGGERWCPLYH